MGIERLNRVREKLIRADVHLQAIEMAEAEYVTTEVFGVRQHELHIPKKSGRPGLTWRADLLLYVCGRHDRAGSSPSRAASWS